MTDNKQSWSIVVFCYNEEGAVQRVLSDVENTLSQMDIAAYEVVVVDDGSSDGSQIKIQEYIKGKSHFSFLPHSVNKGIGQALRTGYFNSKFENICAVPADGQFDILELLPFSFVPDKSFVSFYRKENTTYSIARNILSQANKVINKVFNGFYMLDVNWVKIYKREAIVNLNLELQSSLVESEICAKLILSGHECKEVVSKYLSRTSGVSKGASGKIVIQAVKDTYQLYKVLRKFRKKL
jgi:dolichol-phosphate mannosyltransferase